jgi:hypothetical protein
MDRIANFGEVNIRSTIFFGISFAYVRLHPPSNLDTAAMPSLHNGILLTLGLRLLHV